MPTAGMHMSACVDTIQPHDARGHSARVAQMSHAAMQVMPGDKEQVSKMLMSVAHEEIVT
jgi:hypothetical protein